MSEEKAEAAEAAELETAECLIPSLPDDVALNCIARVPRSEHGTLCLVSKPFLSLVSSPHFFNARSHLYCTQNFLCFIIERFSDPQSWYAVHFSPTPTRPILFPSPPTSKPKNGFTKIVLGHSIYLIGGFGDDNTFSPQVWILDCRFHRWLLGPAMNLGRIFPVAGLIDGKIYVLGGCKDEEALYDDWAEVLDPVATSRWERVASPTEIRKKFIYGGAVMDGKICATILDDTKGGGITFDPRSGIWEINDVMYCNSVQGSPWNNNMSFPHWYRWSRGFVVDGVMYSNDEEAAPWEILWWDVKSGMWKMLKGLEGKGLPTFSCANYLANTCGKLTMVMECNTTKGYLDIYCAEIKVTKNADEELWGEVCWCYKVVSTNANSIDCISTNGCCSYAL